MFITFSILFFISVNAFAYLDGSYLCPTKKDLPEDVYRIQTVSLGGISIPYLQITRHYRANLNDKNSPILKSEISGFATLFTGSDKQFEILSIAAITIEITNNKVKGCTFINGQ